MTPSMFGCCYEKIIVSLPKLWIVHVEQPSYIIFSLQSFEIDYSIREAHFYVNVNNALDILYVVEVFRRCN